MVESIQSLAEDQLWKASYNLEQFLRIVPLLDQYMRLVQHYLTLYVASHRATSKLLSVLLRLFTDLTMKVSTIIERTLRIAPLLDQYMRLVQHYLTLYVASHRATSKLLSVLLRLFTDLTMKVSTIIERTLRIAPLLDQYMRLAQHFLTLYMAIHRISLL